jgi:DNA-binding response OmpR family regulator
VVLESLAHNVGRVVTKERLQQDLVGWEQELSNNAVETHVSRLRAKLGEAAVIRTIRGLGYRLDESVVTKAP